MEALLGGSVDVAAGSVSDVILLASQGHSLHCFFVLYKRPIVALAVAPGLSGKIQSIRGLKGHTVGVSSPGSASQQLLNFLLASNGLCPHDASIVLVGMSTSSIAALENGKVDAGVLIASAERTSRIATRVLNFSPILVRRPARRARWAPMLSHRSP